MSNKIDGPGPGVPRVPVSRPGGAEQRQGVERPAEKQDNAASESARVEVTDAALRMKRLEERVLSMPDVDETRVQEIREKLQSGQFEVDEASVADKLLRFEKGLD